MRYKFVILREMKGASAGHQNQQKWTHFNVKNVKFRVDVWDPHSCETLELPSSDFSAVPSQVTLQRATARFICDYPGYRQYCSIRPPVSGQCVEAHELASTEARTSIKRSAACDRSRPPISQLVEQCLRRWISRFYYQRCLLVDRYICFLPMTEYATCNYFHFYHEITDEPAISEFICFLAIKTEPCLLQLHYLYE